MKVLSEEINWKGIREYLVAARAIPNNITGPRVLCQGLAVELAFKYYLWDVSQSYPGTHDLEHLAFNECQDLSFAPQEAERIELLNRQYLKDGSYYYPSRYRPMVGRVYVTPGQPSVEELIEKIIGNTSTPELATHIIRE